VKSRDGHMPSSFKAGYIEKVIRLDNGFHKTVEMVICLRSDTLAPILQMHTHKFIRTNSYTQIHTYKFIRTNSYAQIYMHKFIRTNSYAQIYMHKFIRTRVYAQIHCSKLNARQCESRTKCFPRRSHLRYL